jgi:pantoate--beta-alanine ligase
MSTPAIPHASRILDLRATTRAWRNAGDTIALVPTMGALHDGHLELVRLARSRAQRVIVSIFVNPAQFAPHEDFDRYPRTLEADLAKLTATPCDLAWAPAVDEMYPKGFATRVLPAGAADGLESDFRPHFFGGVATVCTKLFTQVGPDFAIFGEKDYQQLCVVRQVVRDLDLPLHIVGAPTVREPDGLALSSRNRYLSEAERRVAPILNRALREVGTAVATGGEIAQACSAAAAKVEAAGFAKVDYIEVRDAETLARPTLPSDRPLRVLAAAWLGKTRLIDNVAV